MWPEVSLLGIDWMEGVRPFSVTTGRIVLFFSILNDFQGNIRVVQKVRDTSGGSKRVYPNPIPVVVVVWR
jgi:hypothetical protein